MTRQLSGLCKHCHTPVIRDPRGNWVHTSLSYVCRDRWGTVAFTYAEAAPAHDDTAVRP